MAPQVAASDNQQTLTNKISLHGKSTVMSALLTKQNGSEASSLSILLTLQLNKLMPGLPL